MSKNINSASRLHAILQKAPNHAGNTQTLEAWAKLLDIDEPNVNRKSLMVAEHLRWMHRELGLVGTQMRGANFSEALYSTALSRIEHSLSTMILAGSWNQVQQYLTPDTFVALAFCSEILPDEEAQISADDLADIKTRVEELRESLSESQLPPRLRALVEHHIELISRALAEYPIAGAKALREAAREGLGELIEVHETVKANQGTPEINKLGTTWKKINEVADIALKAEKLAQLGQKAWALLENIF